MEVDILFRRMNEFATSYQLLNQVYDLQKPRCLFYLNYVSVADQF